MIKSLFAIYPAMMPSRFSGSRLPRKMAWQRTLARATINGIQNMLFHISPPNYLTENDTALQEPSHREAPGYLANLTPFCGFRSRQIDELRCHAHIMWQKCFSKIVSTQFPS
jgi:hypothetical protein